MHIYLLVAAIPVVLAHWLLTAIYPLGQIYFFVAAIVVLEEITQFPFPSDVPWEQ